MRITRANNKAIEYACKNFHYAKAVPVNTVGYNVYNSKEEWLFYMERAQTTI